MDLGTRQVKEDFEDQVQDTEITLGTGKLLGIFFTVVIVCAVFFTMGYLLGKSTATGGRTEIVGSTTSVGGSAAGKPSAVAKTPEVPAPTPLPESQAGSSSSSGLNSGGSNSSGSNSGASNPAGTNTAATSSTAPTSPATEIKSSPNGTFMVQVAAVSKQEDAEMQKKQYPVFVANSTADALYHVQVGPFSNQQDADTMRNRLSGDGYNAIVKH